MPIQIRDPSDLSQDYNPLDTSGEAPSFTDYGKAALGTIGDLGAGISSIGRNIAEATSNDPDTLKRYEIYQAKGNRLAEESRESMSQGGRRALEAEVTSDAFWEHPFQSVLMKGAAMTPYLVAGALPGGLIGEAFGATAGMVASGVTGAALNVGAFLNDVDQRIDKATDKQLIDQSDLYAGWRDRMSEEEARKELKSYMAGDGRTALTAIVGVIGGVVGPTGAIARASSGANAAINAAERSALGRAGVGTLEGAVGMGIQTGASAAAGQNAAIAGGFQQDYDWHKWTAETLEAMGLGAVFSAATGAAGGKHGVEIVKPKAPDVAQTAALKATQAETAPPVKPAREIISLKPKENPTETAPTVRETPVAKPTEAAPPVGETPVVKPTETAPPVRETPVAKPTEAAPPAEETPVAKLTDTSTVPESSKTLKIQREELISGERPLVFYPDGTEPPEKQPEGMMRYRVAGSGIYDYNPKLLKGKELSQRIRDNTVQELMGLGPFNKEQVAASAAKGNQEVAVVERNKSGTETRSAASTTELAPTVKNVMDKNKGAGNTVAVESITKPLDERRKAATETKPAETKPAETKPAETKPAETKPAETKPAETKPAETKPKGAAKSKQEGAAKPKETVKETAKEPVTSESNARREPQVFVDNSAIERINAQKAIEAAKSDTDISRGNRGIAEGFDLTNRDNRARFMRQVTKELTKGADAASWAKDVAALPKLGRGKSMTPEYRAALEKAYAESLEFVKTQEPKVTRDEAAKRATQERRQAAEERKATLSDGELLDSIKDLTPTERVQLLKAWKELKLSQAEKLEMVDIITKQKSDLRTQETGVDKSAMGSGAKGDKGELKNPKEIDYADSQELADRGENQRAVSMADIGETTLNAKDLERASEQGEVYQEPITRERPTVQLGEGEGYSAVTGIKEGSVRVEKKRTFRRTRGAGEGEGLSPQEHEILHATNVKDSVKSVNIGELADANRGVNRGIVMKFLERIRQAVGEKDVLVVNQETMDRLNPSKPAGTVDGYYDPQKGHIVVSERFVKDGKIDASILAHEGMHALVQEGLDSNAGLKKTVQEMLDHVKDQFPGEKHYGLENVHEFLSEAVSNAKFQDFLMKLPVPENIAKQLDLKSTSSVWDAMVKSIQKFLGFKESEHNMLTAALRASEMADNAGANIRDHERSIADIRRMLRTSAPETYKDRFDRYVETFREQALDFNRPVEKLVEQIEKVHGKLSDAANVYIQKRLTEARLLERKRQVADYAERTMLPMIRDAEKIGVTPSDISDMLIARHAKERNDYLLAQDPKTKKNSGMTTADAADLLKKISADPAKKAIFDRAVEINDKLREMYLEGNVEYGMLDRKTVNDLRDQFKTFTSLRGFEDEDIAVAAKRSIGVTGRQTSVIGNEYRATKGRETKSDNALHNMLQDVVRMYERGERNLVIKSAADAARVAKFANDADSPFYIAGSVNDKNIRGYDNARNDPRILGFKEDGKQKFLVFKDQDLAEAVQRVAPDQVPAFFRGLVNSTNMLKSLWTHYSPAFLIRHFIFRYPIEGVMNLQGMAERGFDTSATKYLKDSFADIPAMRDYLQGKPVTDPKLAGYIKEMAEAGGVVSFKHISDSLDLKKQIEVLAAKKPNSILEAIKQGHEVWETTLTATDNAQRLAIYTRAREAGMSPQRAALAARDATVDFAKKGRASSWINIWIPFGNVALQTTGRMANAWKESPTYRKTVVGIMAGMTAVEMMNYTMGGTDKDGTPWIDKIPAHERLQNLVMVTPFTDKEGKPYVFKIPLPYPLFAVSGAGNGAAQSVMSLTGKSKLTQGEIATRVFHGVAETFTPVGHQINSLQTLATPEVARFISDISANKDWKGDPIHSERAKPGMMKSEQGYKSTDQSWKTMAGWLGKIGMDMYPEDVKYTVDHFIGAERRFARDTIDTFSGDKNPLTTNPISKILVGKPESFADSSRFRNLSEKATVPAAQMEAVEAKAMGRSLNAGQKALIAAAESRTGMTSKQIYEINKANKEVKNARRDDEDTTVIQQKALKKFNTMGIMGGIDKH